MAASPPIRIRAFIAIPAPEELKPEMAKAQQALKRVVKQGTVRWTGEEQWHLTLKFLGNIDSSEVAGLAAALREVGAGFAPLTLRAAGVGFFPNARQPRVIWVGVREARNQLESLHLAIETAAKGFTAEAPEHRFSGHITLARVKELRRAEAQALAQVARGFSGTVFGDWTVRALEIIRSELGSAGAKYSVLAGVPLGRE